MSAEIYYALKEGAAPVSLAEAQKKFGAAGLRCTVEPEGPDMQWLVFQPSETTILASTKDGHLVFATIEASFDEDPAFIDCLDPVLQSMGFSASDTEEF